MNVVFSPLDHESKCNLIKTFNSKDIIDAYKSMYSIDVKYLLNYDQIHLYECPKTKYKFFHPFDIDGDSYFYEQLQKFPWYYIPWKWEHIQAQNHIKKTDTVLEIGCGSGGFIKEISKLTPNIHAIELNAIAASQLKHEGYKVYNQTIEEFSLENSEQYDIVCSFQVLEHIQDIDSFISSAVKVLKPGGKLIIGVPNNDSFIKFEEFSILNMPPHHMGLWDKHSLESICKYYGLRVLDYFEEPLQSQHYGHYYNVFLANKIGNKLGKIVAKLTRFFAKHIVGLFSKKIKGEGILYIYKKEYE